MRTCGCIIGLLVATPTGALAQQTGSTLTWDGLIDIYYAYDFNRPPGGNRSYATEPFRHNEFALNLALARVQYTSAATPPRVRASFGTGIGTYMEANYAAEPQMFQNVYEAYAGISLGNSGNTWLDAGILPSHIGFESAISVLDWTWSRSLIAENSPYYETGIRLTMQPDSQWTFAVLALNGWQNIRDLNRGKAVGAQIVYQPKDWLLFNYSNFLGDEAPDSVPAPLTRFFHDFHAQLTISDRVVVIAGFDIGTQERAVEDLATWYGGALLARVQLATKWAITGRWEFYHDPDQVIVVTGVAAGLVVPAGGSLTLDYRPAERALFRLEGRVYRTNDFVWPAFDGLRDSDGFLLGSLAITF